MIDDFIGINYSKRAHKPSESGSNCNGLIYSYSDAYRAIIDHMDGSLNFLHMDDKILSLYEEIDFEKREKDCIIFFKDKNKRSWEHVAIFVDKNYILHNEETRFGSKIDNIDLMLFRNFDIKVFKEK